MFVLQVLRSDSSSVSSARCSHSLEEHHNQFSMSDPTQAERPAAHHYLPHSPLAPQPISGNRTYYNLRLRCQRPEGNIYIFSCIEVCKIW